MEEQKELRKSIWGNWWEPIRKWFYPLWLIYETSIRFYDYAQSVHDYFIRQQEYISSYIGETGTLTLAVLCSAAAFAICTAFLIIPSCFVLYEFFKEDNLTGTRFEEKMKRMF